MGDREAIAAAAAAAAALLLMVGVTGGGRVDTEGLLGTTGLGGGPLIGVEGATLGATTGAAAGAAAAPLPTTGADTSPLGPTAATAAADLKKLSPNFLSYCLQSESTLVWMSVSSVISCARSEADRLLPSPPIREASLSLYSMYCFLLIS